MKSQFIKKKSELRELFEKSSSSQLEIKAVCHHKCNVAAKGIFNVYGDSVVQNVLSGRKPKSL